MAKLYLTCPKEYLEKNLFKKIGFILFFFLILGWFFFTVFRKIFGRFPELSFTRSLKNFEVFFRKQFGFNFELCRKMYVTYDYKVSPMSSKQHSVYREDLSRKIQFIWKFSDTLETFWNWLKFCWIFGDKISAALLKLYSTHPAKRIEEH